MNFVRNGKKSFFAKLFLCFVLISVAPVLMLGTLVYTILSLIHI